MQASGGNRGGLTAERFEALLAQRGFGPGPWSLEPLKGGYWNHVFKATSSRESLVLKHFRAVMPDSLFPNLPEAEAEALARLSGLQVAPELRAYWRDEGVLVYDFVAGRSWRSDAGAVAQLLLRKEQVTGAGFRRVPISPEAILSQGVALFARCATDELVAAFAEMRPAPVAMHAPERLSLIHTDIGATNLIGSGDTLRLIDWQCPAEGDVTEDIYSFLSPAFQILNLRSPLLGQQQEDFFSSLDCDNLRRRHHLMRPFYAYRMAGYCCLRQQTAPEPDVRERYLRAAKAELELLRQHDH